MLREDAIFLCVERDYLGNVQCLDEVLSQDEWRSNDHLINVLAS